MNPKRRPKSVVELLRERGTLAGRNGTASRPNSEPHTEEYPGDHILGNLPAGAVEDGWEQPVPLSVAPVVEEFPVEVFPQLLARFAAEAAAAVGCPVDYLTVPMLAVAGGAIGASKALAVKRGYVQRALLYAAVVGPPGDGKTPALSLVAGPIHEAQQKARALYEQELQVYEAAARRALMFKEARALPARGEAVHAIMTGSYDLMLLLVALLDLHAAPCRRLRIATLCYNRRNAVEMLGLLETKKIGALTWLASDFFRGHNKELDEWFRGELAAYPGSRIAAARNHCKIVCFEWHSVRRKTREPAAPSKGERVFRLTECHSELLAFHVKVKVAANETFEAWRERDHDDLVLAVAMAAWLAEHNGQDPGPTVIREETHGLALREDCGWKRRGWFGTGRW